MNISTERKRFFAVSWFKYAAVFLLIAGCGLFLYKRQAIYQQKTDLPVVSALRPGEARVVLHMAKGEKVMLPDSNWMVVRNGSDKGVEIQDSLLVYHIEAQTEREVLNVLEVPPGGEFRLELSDGTRIWLNAASRLSFPENFVGKERRVELEGEGYFEVAADAERPFIVKVKDMTLKVLGTSFNLKAFPEERLTMATLLTGKVEVSTLQEKVVLHPDQQAILSDSGGRLDIREVDAGLFRAWTKGWFVFRRERLENILNDIARWYQVKIVYAQEAAKEICFSGTMNRYKEITQTLQMIENTGKVIFDINQENIVVSIQENREHP